MERLIKPQSGEAVGGEKRGGRGEEQNEIPRVRGAWVPPAPPCPPPPHQIPSASSSRVTPEESGLTERVLLSGRAALAA